MKKKKTETKKLICKRKLTLQERKADSERMNAASNCLAAKIRIEKAVFQLQKDRKLIENDARTYQASSFLYHDIGNAIHVLSRDKLTGLGTSHKRVCSF